MLIKGPIVYAFLLPGIVIFELWRRRRASQRVVAEALTRASISIANECERLVWLVAMDRFTSCLFVMGDRRHLVSTWLL